MFCDSTRSMSSSTGDKCNEMWMVTEIYSMPPTFSFNMIWSGSHYNNCRMSCIESLTGLPVIHFGPQWLQGRSPCNLTGGPQGE